MNSLHRSRQTYIVTLFLAGLLCMLPNLGYSQQSATSSGSSGSSSTSASSQDLPEDTVIVIRETPENLLKIEQIIRSLDVPPKQVMIEAHIFDVALDNSNSTGIDWSTLMTQIGRDGPLWQFTNSLSVLGSDGKPAGNGVLKFGTLNNEHFTMLINGLKKHNRAKSLSNPKVTALNGKPAIISINQRYPYTTTESYYAEGVVRTQTSVKFQDIPISLAVTPRIYNDNTIRLNVNPKISSLISVIDGVPWTESRSTQTEVIIHNGETLILGGLITENKSNSNDSVPLFDKIPFARKLFARKSRASKRSELVIFITPTIITSSKLPRISAAGQSTVHQPQEM